MHVIFFLKLATHILLSIDSKIELKIVEIVGDQKKRREDGSKRQEKTEEEIRKIKEGQGEGEELKDRTRDSEDKRKQQQTVESVEKLKRRTQQRRQKKRGAKSQLE